MSQPPSAPRERATLPGTVPRRVASLRPRTLAALVGGLVLGAALVVDHWYKETAVEVERGRAVGMLSPRRAALENAINERMAVLRGVAAHLAVHWDTPDMRTDFDAYAALIGRDESIGVRSVQYVRDGVVTHSWPRGGNEQALGRNLLADPRPEIISDFRAAVERGHIVLSGPTDLYQGGTGLIGRLRAAIPGDTVSVVAAVVLDFPLILSLSGLPALEGLSWRLRDATGRIIAGTSALDTTQGGVVRLPVRLPDREWHLEGSPSAGWAATIGARRLPVRLGLLGAVLLAALIAWTLQSRREAQREAELSEERQRAEEKFRLLFQLVPDGVVLARAEDGLILEINDAYARIVNRPREALLGHTMAEMGLWASAEERAEARRVLAEVGQLSEVRFGIGMPDGSRREGIYSCSRVVVDGLICYLSIVRDVHERLEAERRSLEGQRLESIGRLAGGIAHDFNNLITGIAGYADLARHGLAPDDPRRADLGEISRAAARAAELTRQLLTFARRQVTAPKLVDLAELVREAHGLLRQLAGEDITLVLEVPSDPAPVRLDPVQVEQVLTNLVVNARDAMPGGGLLVVAVQVVGPTVELAVTDTGTGIAAEHLPHLFEPFYTTKAPGAGTGLGLAMVHGIVEQAGGQIAVETQVGEGTTFRLRFARAAAGAPPERTLDPVLLERPGGSEVILIAEDEPQVRSLAARVLRALGYEVLTAEDGTEALALAAAHRGPLHLLVTDMVMPRMGGGELVRRLAELQPALKVLRMSGYSEELVAAEAGGHPVHQFLQKPFTPQELADAVRAALDS